jgi:1-deoxy-D-xylulose-5-phosphate synthase
MRFVKPLDEELILKIADSHEALVTLEDNVVPGGAGSAVSECLSANARQFQMLHLGLPDALIETGSREEMLAEAGLDYAGILRSIEERFGRGLLRKPAAAERA